MTGLKPQRALIARPRAGSVSSRVEAIAEVEVRARMLRGEGDCLPIELTGALQMAGILDAIAFGEQSLNRLELRQSRSRAPTL